MTITGNCLWLLRVTTFLNNIKRRAVSLRQLSFTTNIEVLRQPEEFVVHDVRMRRRLNVMEIISAMKLVPRTALSRQLELAGVAR